MTQTSDKVLLVQNFGHKIEAVFILVMSLLLDVKIKGTVFNLT